jgi:selenocysteine-specific elongation factor
MTAPPPRHLVLGTAGHVDHGKTALVKALTGVDTDRLKEEQLRGISIELGFAELRLGDDIVLGVVDVPGHERFVRQMVAGAGGVDLAVLIVAADEGVMPQTVEHLEILASLGVKGGVIVLTKSDLVDEVIAAVVAEEVRDLARGTFLETAPAVAVSSVTGAGLAELRRVLREEAERLPPRVRTGPFRLPVDRVFTLPGVGVVVTGTCWSGAVAPGDILAAEPGGLKVRVREVQAHGAVVPEGGSGQRLALALHGVKKEDLTRGDQIVTPQAVTPGSRLDARVTLVPHWRGTLRNRQRLHVHHAGREVLGRVLLLDSDELGGEDTAMPRAGLVQLVLEAPLVALPDDRFVLRFYSPVTTVAGGRVLGVDAPTRRRHDPGAIDTLAVREQGEPAAVFRQALSEAGAAGLAREAVAAHAGDAEAVAVVDRLYHRDVLADLSARIAILVADYNRRFPLRLGIPKEEARRRVDFPGGRAEWVALCEVLAPLGGWVVAGDRIAPSAEGPPLTPALARAAARREEALRAYGLQWPGLEGFREALAAEAVPGLSEEEFLKHLVDHDRAVQAGSDYYVATQPFADLVAMLRGHFAVGPELTFARFRELSGLSRKLGIPMLEHLDQVGLTVRIGDSRRAGPAMDRESE